MNKNSYRVIFNKARGLMVVVAEIVASHHCVSTKVDVKARIQSRSPRIFARLSVVTYLTQLALGLGVFISPWLQADIIADNAAPTNQQPSISTTANGITQVNIQTPNASGLSHNVYSRFDVERQGAILNNSRTTVQTQLGGFVLGNPNLATGTASTILNEVNASGPSQLRGFIEVAGDRARVIVANPAGITCDGCGFINVNHATLTTGETVINSGNLESFVVRRGTVSIEGDGLDARQTNFTDVIARAVRVNANLLANDIRMTTGANQVNADNSIATPISAEVEAPAFAIDVSELGGMYAGKIRLVATEQGVGVRNAGTIGASAGNVQLTADGRIINSGQITASVDVAITGNDDVENEAVIAADQDLSINATGQLRNTGHGTIYADNIRISTATVENSKHNDVAAVIAARKTLTVSTQTLNNQDGAILYSGDEINLTATTINNDSALVDAVGDINITTETLNNSNENFQTKLVETASETIQEFALVGSLNRYQPQQVHLRPDRNDNVNYLVTPEGEDDAYNQFDYTRRIEQTEITESDPAQISAGGDLYITANTVINDNSRIIAGGTLTAELDTLINNETAGQRITRENGTITTYSRRHRRGSDSTRITRTAYNPAPAVQSINLNQAAFAGNTNVANSNTSVPLLSNTLFRRAPDPAAGYLIETDPRFTNQRLFLSSDFVLDQLVFDPALSQKRLGDGFYEQQLVREQVAQLTGRRFLENFTDDETQYRVLLNAGITTVNEFNLQPGISLSAEQVAQLTSDVVLLVEQEVTLENGAVTKALVPQLYVRPQAGELNGNGGLVAARNITINTTQAITNRASIVARQTANLNADNIHNEGGLVTASSTKITAVNDINIQGGEIGAEDSLQLNAGNNINATSTTSTQHNSQGQRTNINRLATIFVSNAEGMLVASAGKDIKLNATQISNTGANGQTQLTAGNNIELGTVSEDFAQGSIRNTSNFRKETGSDESGSSITGKGTLSLTARNSIHARAAVINSEAATVDITAGHDVRLSEGRSKRGLDEGLKTTSKGFLSSTVRTRRDIIDEDSASGSIVSAENIEIKAGHDVNIIASDVVATSNININAENKLTIQSATNKQLVLNLREKKKSGVFSSGGFGITIGKQQRNVDTRNQIASAALSTIGSTQGNITLSAGDRYAQTASRLVAGQGDISISAKDINIESATNTVETITETKFKQSGLSISITNPVLSALQTIKRVNDASKRVKDSRLKKLATTTKVLAALGGYEAINARLAKVARDAIDSGNEAAKDTNTGDKAKDNAADTSTLADKVGGINVSISLGRSKQHSKTVQTAKTTASSTFSAGNNIVLIATGEQGNVSIKGSQFNAGQNILLQAQNNIDLLASQNHSSLTSKNSSSNSSIGGSFGSNGPALSASISKGKGAANGKDSTFTNTHISAGKAVGLVAGKDAQLTGAVVSAEQVLVTSSGDLNIASLQETSTYQSRQKNNGLSVGTSLSSFSPTGSINLSRSNVDTDYKSVTEQSAIHAGDGGFQVNVQGNTNLTGAVITSTEQAEKENKNAFVTGTLTTTDLQNIETTAASQTGIGLSSGPFGKYKIAKTVLSTLSTNTNLASEQQSTTPAGIGTENIHITNETQQQTLTGKTAAETIASLNKDVLTGEDSSNALTKTDGQQLDSELQATATIKKEFSKQIIAITDDAYKTLFLRKPKFYKVTCPAGADCVANPQRAITSLVTAEEVAKNGSKETVIAVNGIFNGLERAGELAYQNAKNVEQTVDNPDGRKPDTIYLLHYVPANGRIAEFLATGYEKLLTQSDYETGKSLGYSNVDIALAEVLRERGDRATQSLAHSRGTQVQANTFKILANELDAQGNTYQNDKLTVRSLGAATNLLDLAVDARKIGVYGENIRASVFNNDSVSALFAGIGRTVSIGELISSLFDTIFTTNSAHSCYGTGAAGCKQVEIPLKNGPELASRANNSRLLKFRNGELLQKDRSQK